MYKPWKKIKKTLKAPSYFKETRKIIEGIEEEVSTMLGVGVHWLKQQEGKDPKLFSQSINEFAERKNWSEHDRYKVKFLLNSTSVFINYAWVRFITEHINDEWGKVSPDLLTYNESSDEIMMCWFISRTKKVVNKIIKPIKRIFLTDKYGKKIGKKEIKLDKKDDKDENNKLEK